MRDVDRSKLWGRFHPKNSMTLVKKPRWSDKEPISKTLQENVNPRTESGPSGRTTWTYEEDGEAQGEDT